LGAAGGAHLYNSPSNLLLKGNDYLKQQSADYDMQEIEKARAGCPRTSSKLFLPVV
jgi:hypothetical protein